MPRGGPAGVRGRALLRLAALAAAAVPAAAGVNGMLSFPLELDETRCFYEEVKDRDSKVYMHVVVQDGGYDLTVRVTGPFQNRDEPIRSEEGRVVYADTLEVVKGEKRLLFRAMESQALYRFCFQNGGVMMKSISVVLKSNDPMEQQVGPYKPMEPIKRTIIRISEALNSIKEDQQWIKVRERHHRDLAESACESVLYWSVASAVMLLAVGGTQMWYYNNMFRDGKGGMRGRGA